jgi:rRNA-processing protein EBP2
VEDAISDRPSKRSKGPGGVPAKSMSRKVRDSKFGFGGSGKRSKQNTRSSTDDFVSTGFGGKKTFGKGAKGGARRPGKSKRIDARTRS